MHRSYGSNLVMNDLAKAIMSHTIQPGLFTTAIPELSLVRMDTLSKALSPVVYEPCIYIVAQGSKQAYLADELYIYDALNFLVLSVHLPLQCKVTQASEERPYLALKLDVNNSVLSELVMTLQSSNSADALLESNDESSEQRNDSKTDRGIFVSPMGSELQSCLIRLIASLDDQASIEIIAPMLIKEILFYVLRGQQGPQLREFVSQDRNAFRISSCTNYIQQNYTSAIDVNQLAAIAGMSVSSFHHYFKEVTNASPLQYIKSIRLHAAKKKIVLNSLSVSDAAFQVGYTSPSQFSREYKRFFGRAPSADAQ